jgi:hypothetical protein
MKTAREMTMAAVSTQTQAMRALAMGDLCMVLVTGTLDIGDLAMILVMILLALAMEGPCTALVILRHKRV